MEKSKLNLANKLREGLESQYRADIAKAKAELSVYFLNPVGIGEHPQILEELDKLVAKLAEAEDKLHTLQDFKLELGN